MVKKQKVSNKSYLFVGLIGLAVIAFGAIGLTVAYNGGSPTTVFEGDCVNCTNEASNAVAGFGARQSDNASGYWDVYVENDLQVDGAFISEGDVTTGVLTTGGGDYNSTTTDAATYTLVQADIEDYSYLDLNFTATDAITYTMPATSTMMTILPEVGSTRTWIIHNASTTAVLTLAAGAGMNLLGIDTNVDTIAGDGWATLECIQSVYAAADNENISCLMSEYVVAD